MVNNFKIETATTGIFKHLFIFCRVFINIVVILSI